MKKLMTVTPFYKSVYWWLGILVYTIAFLINIMVFKGGWVGFGVAMILAAVYMFWLAPMARTAQFEADWVIPNKPRIDINE